MKRMKEKMEPKDFFDFPKSVRDAAEKMYDIFERDTLRNILKKKEAPSMWRSITSTLSPKEAEQATELAFAWSAEDSMSSSRFPEAIARNTDYVVIDGNEIIDGPSKDKDDLDKSKGKIYQVKDLDQKVLDKHKITIKEKDIKTIKIKEEFQVPGTDVILEDGDKIQILKENRILTVRELLKQLQNYDMNKEVVCFAEGNLYPALSTQIFEDDPDRVEITCGWKSID